MRWIGLDPGQARCGLALSDPLGILASPLAILPVEPRQSLAQRVAEALMGHGVRLEAGELAGIVCGLALDERGREGDSARQGRALADLLYAGLRTLWQPVALASEPIATSPAAVTFELVFLDERFSTADMQRRRSAAGVKLRKQKGEIDAWAASAILQDFLDRRKAEPLTPDED